MHTGAETLADYTYGPTGAMENASYGEGRIAGTYSYTIRDWIKDIDYDDTVEAADLFGSTLAHEDNGNVASQAHSYGHSILTGNTSAYTYDGLSRLTGVTATAGGNAQYTYDRNGNILTRTIGAAATSYQYNASGKPNRLMSTTGENVRTYTYDAAGRVTGDAAHTFAYDARGQLETVTLPSGTTTDYLYDDAGLRVSKTPAAELLFEDDFDDNDISDWYVGGGWGLGSGTLDKTTATGGTVGYTGATFTDFQASFRAIITSTPNSNWIGLQFRKDEADDLHWQSGYMVYYRGNGGLDLYEAGVGVIASTATGKTLDVWREVVVRAEGSQISVWVDGELELVHTDGTFTGGYLGFRGHNVLASFDDLKVESVEGRYYVRSASGQVLAEYDEAGDVVTEYLYAGGRRTAEMRKDEPVRFNLKDHLGTVRAVVDAAGTLLEAHDYYPFGSRMPGRSFVAGPPTTEGFTGHEMDDETGLYYAAARYLDPVIGRWTSVDPLGGDYPGHSVYDYVLNNPANLIDPSGLCPEGYGPGQTWNGANCMSDEITIEAERPRGGTSSAFYAGGTFYFNSGTTEGRSGLAAHLRSHPGAINEILHSGSYRLGAQQVAASVSREIAGTQFWLMALRISIETGADFAAVVSMLSGAGAALGVGGLLLRKAGVGVAKRGALDLIQRSGKNQLLSSASELTFRTGAYPIGGDPDKIVSAMIGVGLSSVSFAPGLKLVQGVSITHPNVVGPAFHRIGGGFVTDRYGLTRWGLANAPGLANSIYWGKRTLMP